MRGINYAARRWAIAIIAAALVPVVIIIGAGMALIESLHDEGEEHDES